MQIPRYPQRLVALGDETRQLHGFARVRRRLELERPDARGYCNDVSFWFFSYLNVSSTAGDTKRFDEKPETRDVSSQRRYKYRVPPKILR